MTRRIAAVTGASSGIGEATARELAQHGFDVVLGARRLERLERLASEIIDAGGAARPMPLDVTDQASVDAFVEAVPDLHLLVNSAGGAFGREPVAGADVDAWLRMYDLNVLGTARMTRAFLPALERSGDGHVVVVGSIAGFEVYSNGAGYTGVKHAERALVQTLRIEALGKPIRVTEVNPGLVETEFSLVRFAGDERKAKQVYEGMTPLTAEDVADCIVWAATRPSRVNVDEIVVRPRDQASATLIHRTRDRSAD